MVRSVITVSDIIKKMDLLENFAKHMRQGDLTTVSGFSETDELEKLGANIDKMSSSLRVAFIFIKITTISAMLDRKEEQLSAYSSEMRW